MKRVKRYQNIFKGVQIPWIMLAVLLILNILESYIFLEQATLTADIIDTSQNAIKTEQLVRFIVVLMINSLLSISMNYIKGWNDQKLSYGVRNKLWNKLMHLPSRHYDLESGDSLVSRITTDSDYSSTYFNVAISLITAVYAGAVTVKQMYKYNPQLTLYMLIAIPFTLVISALMGKLSFAANKKAQVSFADSLAYLVERTRNLRLIKASRMEYTEQVEGKKRFDCQFRVSLLSSLVNSLTTALIPIFGGIGIVVSFVVGGKLVREGAISVGRLVGFYTLSSLLSTRFLTLLQLYTSLKEANGRLDKVAELLETPDENQEGIEFDVADADLVAEDVSFSYSDRPVLDGVNFRIPKGQITAIVGPNGAGKSTMFKLLERMYDPDIGTLRFGNDDIRKYDLASWRGSFAIVSQDKPLLSGTVRENILYGVRRKVEEEELIHVAKLANIYDFVMATPGGFDAPVGMGGSNFSGGQRQCIAIARAMMRNPDYLLLDEATSNLDAKSEQLVSQALANLMKGRTTVMIAHNYSATRDATHIVVMKDGKVEAEGSPEEMLASNEYYRAFACKSSA
ncbi:MAG: ABC transporter ATP-binding protein [Oscillospiraceae bacterium]|nr:ABC transporter ATP-binding protein [Oscillospiraceae bacterium]